MKCSEARDRLTAADGSYRDSSVAGHLEDCSACRTYVERLQTARGLLRDHHGNFEPDPAFADRVAARLPQGSTEVLGWAATRLLPASIALVLALSWFVFRSSPDVVIVDAQAPTDDLVSWVIEGSDGAEP